MDEASNLTQPSSKPSGKSAHRHKHSDWVYGRLHFDFGGQRSGARTDRWSGHRFAATSALIKDMDILAATASRRMTGNEPFHMDGNALHVNVLSFWQWSSSELVGNALRGMLAEFIVASAVGSVEGVRREWDAVDIRTADGVRVEVKSGAYLQSWSQKKHSVIQFGIQPTQGWDASTNIYSNSVTRQSDVYVFCVLSHMRKETVDPLNLQQWQFFVVATKVLNEAVGSQKTITLSSLRRLHPIEATYENIAPAIKQALVVSGRSDR